LTKPATSATAFPTRTVDRAKVEVIHKSGRLEIKR